MIGSMKTNIFLKNQNGGALVEFGLILPFLILLIFGIIEFSLLLFNQQVITNASREGARAGIIMGPDRGTGEHISESRTVAEHYCRGNLVTFSNSGDCNIDYPNPGTLSGSEFTVTVSYNYGFLVLSSLGFNPIDLSAESVMILE